MDRFKFQIVMIYNIWLKIYGVPLINIFLVKYFGTLEFFDIGILPCFLLCLIYVDFVLLFIYLY